MKRHTELWHLILKLIIMKHSKFKMTVSNGWIYACIDFQSDSNAEQYFSDLILTFKLPDMANRRRQFTPMKAAVKVGLLFENVLNPSHEGVLFGLFSHALIPLPECISLPWNI